MADNQNQGSPNAARPGERQAPAPRHGKYIVACSLPHGLTIFEERKSPSTLGSGEIMIRVGEPITLKGKNAPGAIGGFGLTEIDADLWDQWVKTHQDFPAIRSGAIHWHEKRDRALDASEERRGEQNGFEGIDPEKPSDKIPESKGLIKPAAAGAEKDMT